MALEDRGQTPGVTWQTSFDTRPQCRSRTSSVWLGPTACKTVRKLELRCCQKQNYRQQTDRRRRRGQTEQRALTGAKPNRAGTDAANHTEAPWRAREPVIATLMRPPAFFPQTSKPTICTLKCCLTHQITKTIKAFLLPFTAPPSSTVPCRFIFPLPL